MNNTQDIKYSDDSSGFVLLDDSNIILDIRYYSSFNFVGERIDGYEEPIAIVTLQAAEAIKEVNKYLLKNSYCLKVYDTYRPVKAVEHFIRWSLDPDDIRMKEYFYPNIDKKDLFNNYLAKKSGHSRGSTVDLTIFDLKNNEDLDMGGTFDLLDVRSHFAYDNLTLKQKQNRTFLRETMMNFGFVPIEKEWWHFTLKDEPFKDTYFTFPVNSSSL